MSKKLLASILACVFAVSCFALAACSAPAQSRSTESISADAKDVVVEKEPPSSDPFYVLVVGNDSRVGTVEIDKDYYSDGKGRSDTTMLVRVDPKTYTVSIITIPRDTACDYDGWEYKFNEAYHMYGIQGTLEQVKLLTGVEPKYYLDTTFVGFEKFIDAFGGIDAYVPIDMSLQDIVGGDTINLSAGEQKLNGPEALVFARVRKAFSDYGSAPQEAYRQVDDRSIVENAIRAVVNGKVPTDIAVKALLSNCDTNFDPDDFKYYVDDFAANPDKLTIYSTSGPFDGDTNANGDWLTFRDEEIYAQIIAKADAGEDPNEVLPHPEF